MTATDHADGVVPPPTGAPGPAQESLQAERDFLLRSIADLESEHASGELADDRYEELVDGYTVQAATVLRAIERLEPIETDLPPGVAPLKGQASGRERGAEQGVLRAAL